MTPKQKAEKLVNEFYRIIPLDKMTLDYNLAKKCSLIAVDEILEEYKEDYEDIHKDIFTIYSWWKKVKKEIEAL
jgi:hypothetical protein